MKKLFLAFTLLFCGLTQAQLVDEQNVTITMDLQPILQLEMNGSPNVDFVFDDIADYMGGITKYGATQLKVSSSISWDLYAVGTSAAAATNFWDNQVSYGNISGVLDVTTLPLEALELHQDKTNPSSAGATGPFDDYFTNFGTSPVATGANNIYTSAAPYTRPAVTEKYIAGHNAATDFVAGGSYLLLNATVGAGSNYWYSIDYRLVPGLPAIFPNARTNAGVARDIATVSGAGTYARPGVYTMNVKYVLVEN